MLSVVGQILQVQGDFALASCSSVIALFKNSITAFSDQVYGGGAAGITNASVSVFPGGTGGPNLGASTAPWTQTVVPPYGGTSGTNAMISAGSFITTNTGANVTYTVVVNVYAGTVTTFRGYSYVTFTRIG